MADEYTKMLAEGIKKLQATTTDDAIKREIVKQLIYKRADFISAGVKVVGVQQFDNLDIKYAMPSEASVEYPVPEGAGASLSLIDWTEFTFSMQKAEGRFMITDEARIRGVDNVQWQISIRRLGESLAYEKDKNILDTLINGAGNTFSASATWDTATASQITADIAKGLNYVMSAKGVVDSDINRVALVLPMKAWTGLLRVVEIGNINRSIRDFIEDGYGIQILPSKYLTTDAIMLVKGAETAIHAVLRPPAGIPLVEQKRHEGVGTEYIVRQFFNTKVIPESSSQTSSTNRICVIEDVAS
ncbi:MAG: hypothetical protein DRJ38_00030 [Thermoprotei archaeon]|nr:MAG: hypothetical protein DRJ38_00030 [Thermoprotei archaeon]